MRLFRHGRPGRERPGLFDISGKMRDLSPVIPDFDAGTLSPQGLARLAGLDARGLPLLPEGTRFGACTARPGKIICVGLNYASTMIELGVPRPEAPSITIKPSSALAGPDDDIALPRGSTATDWEVELAAVIGTYARHVSPRRALDNVAGYCLANDLSERDHQRHHGGESVKGRGHDGFARLGPWLVTADEIPDPQGIDLWLRIDGRRIQQGSTSDMLWSVAELIAHVSDYMALEPGDVIQTGTPAGIGIAQKPPRYLREGNQVSLGGSGLGMQRCRVVRQVMPGK
ncbi:fumarylacetoacetate hydrolase family protein [Paracoccus denitrificans]|uniref:5-carboxymethyl-2-hydroxymuconate delta-isomerase n=1 Tax=Paracoccus denitrificans (strain Pd 1222) TaxID=318586 RepID=A1AYL5_PARDP|nr:fumarylacetoacetate hydrolase family protein [Paracoccus denitrificans]ABL68359.1 5-carboxymethyl-2-hydroxymuconate delta-isomerase [Paracoccus denitrificans PD1222]MBB4627875.1 2-keto-4-pentenoate hydratase/2-oxohepta-3-ene-1,7-dioic acid hydratase in catechol pathway [Paracoccus denitrificans]MCU7428590.1 fumarylacetoacetate hydrolase family protein [Paracoccus denitrificans]QAR26441.1 FAA hydrolase family protein [Paracoccus denitrificans]UPV95378.1 fumarylacetoacetate hydrolase family p